MLKRSRSAMFTERYECPLGAIEMTVRDGKLIGVRLGGPSSQERSQRRQAGTPPEMRAFIEFLDAYFEGRPERFDLSMADLSGATDFQRRVYGALARIGFGRTISYGHLAELGGFAGAARAVGRCMRANPVPIFVPCHRVVRADGRLGGFSAGLQWKRRLLSHEGWLTDGDRVRPSCGT